MLHRVCLLLGVLPADEIAEPILIEDIPPMYHVHTYNICYNIITVDPQLSELSLIRTPFFGIIMIFIGILLCIKYIRD